MAEFQTGDIMRDNNTKLGVKDEDVQSRLQAIETKLDGVLKTEVTGSNLLDQITLDVGILIPASTRVGEYIIDTSDCNFLAFAFRAVGQNPFSTRFTIRHVLNGNGSGGHIDVNPSSAPVSNRRFYNKIEVLTNETFVYFYNDETEDIEFDLYVFKYQK